MMGFKGKVYIPDGTGTSISGEFLTHTTSFYSRINNYCATETERNTLAATMTAPEKLGARFWCDDRKGFSFWDGTRWLWEPQRNVLFSDTRPSAANTGVSSTTPISLIPTGALTLPPGNRRVRIVGTSNVSSLVDGATAARLYTAGSQRDQRYVPPGAGLYSLTLRVDWEYVVSGSIDAGLWGLAATATSALSFVGSTLDVYDLGPV